MSRNLAQQDCYFCRSMNIVLEEEPRPITKDDCGAYLDEFQGMLVAKAHCYRCDAKYLAWIDGSARAMYPGHPRPPSPGYPHGDLSFRSTFNDEPGPTDYPKYMVTMEPKLEPWPKCARCAGPVGWQGVDGQFVCADYRCNHVERR